MHNTRYFEAKIEENEGKYEWIEHFKPTLNNKARLTIVLQLEEVINNQKKALTSVS